MTPAPIVLFVYNRPEHMLRVVQSLAANPLARSSELWIFSDGPRDERMRERVQQVRQAIEGVVRRDLFDRVHVMASPHNLGLANSVIGGVGKVLQERGKAIVLEDDLVLSPDFLDFMNQALAFYERDPTIGSVTAFSPLQQLPSDYPHSVYRVPRNCSQGWGTWVDRWQQVDWTAPGYQDLLSDWSVRRAFDRCGSDRSDRLQRQMQGLCDSWSIRFGYWQFRQGWSTIYPAVNRIQNIGYDGSGIHSGVGKAKNADIPGEPVPFELGDVAEDRRIVAEFRRVYSGGIATRTRRYLRQQRDAMRSRRRK